MLFTFDPKDLSPLARVVVYVLIYLEGVCAGLLGILSSLVGMAWEITWPVLARPVRRVWPGYGGCRGDKEWLPWCEVSYSSRWDGDPLEICRMRADRYVISWGGWAVDLFTSPRVDRLLSLWVPTEAELLAAKAS